MLWILVTLAATAAPPTLRLEVRPTTVAACPSDAELRGWLRTLLRRDPFAPDAARRVTLTVRPSKVGVVATTVHSTGGERRLEAITCRSAVKAAAFSIAVALDPFGVTTPLPPDPPAPPVAPPLAPRTAPPPAPRVATPVVDRPPRPETPTAPLILVEPHLAVGHRPAPGAGFRLGGGLRRGGFEGVLAATWLPATARDFGGGRVSANLVAAEVLGCWVWRPLGLCGVALAGWQRGSGAGFARNGSHDAFHLGAGLHVDGRYPLSPHLDLRLSLEGLALASVTRLEVGGAEAWTGDPFAGRLGLGFSWAFPVEPRIR